MKAKAEELKGKVQKRWTTEQATLVAIDVIADEYEPRVAALESQLAELLTKLGEGGQVKGKGGK